MVENAERVVLESPDDNICIQAIRKLLDSDYGEQCINEDVKLIFLSLS